MKNSPLRNRIREYEDAYRIRLPKRTPVFKENRDLIEDLVWPPDEEGS